MQSVAANHLLHGARFVMRAAREVQKIVRRHVNLIWDALRRHHKRAPKNGRTHRDEASAAQQFIHNMAFWQGREFVKVIVISLAPIGAEREASAVDQTSRWRIRQLELSCE